MVRGRLVDAEWTFFEPFVTETGPKRGCPPGDYRRVLDRIFWIARTGVICPMNSASGARSIGSFSDGREPDFGTFCPKPWQTAKPFQIQFK